MAEQTVSRDFNKKHEKEKPIPGIFSATAGVRFFATEIEEPDDVEPSQEVNHDDGAP